MSNPLNPEQRINLARASVLLADGSAEGLSLLAHILSGFGVRTFQKCGSAAEAESVLKDRVVDLIITDAVLVGGTGYDFVSRLRHSKLEPNCYAPVIMVTGHTQLSNIAKGRDCGASFVVAKPLTPAVVLDRILWVARENRPMIDAGSYVGPERRFRSDGPPVGIRGRRREDMSAEPETTKAAGSSVPASLSQPPKRASA